MADGDRNSNATRSVPSPAIHSRAARGLLDRAGTRLCSERERARCKHVSVAQWNQIGRASARYLADLIQPGDCLTKSFRAPAEGSDQTSERCPTPALCFPFLPPSPVHARLTRRTSPESRQTLREGWR